MNIVVNEELKAYIDPLTTDEYEALERSLLTEGCRDALVLWGDLLVDGHNRYGICQKHSIPFNTLQSTLFKNLDDVHLWMIDQHLGRRSVSDFQRGVLAIRKREIFKDRKTQAAVLAESTHGASDAAMPSDRESPAPSPSAAAMQTREDLAKAARLSSSQVVLIERIQKQATPELVAAVKSGTISINAAAAVSTLPEQEQVEAAMGGKEQLLQAAKRVRGTKKRAQADGPSAPEESTQDKQDTVAALRGRIVELEAENNALREQLARIRA